MSQKNGGIRMLSKRILLCLVFLAILICPMVAAYDFTNIVNTSNVDTYYNVSRVANPVSAVPLESVLWLASLGIILLVLSFFARPDQCNDILAIMAVFPLGVASWRFLTIDIVTSGVGATFNPRNNVENSVFMLMEQHSSTALYHEAVMCGVFFIIAILNVYRIILTNRELAEMKDPEITKYGDD